MDTLRRPSSRALAVRPDFLGLDRLAVALATLLLLATPALAQPDSPEELLAEDGTILNTKIPTEEALASVKGPARLAIVFDLASRERTLNVEPHELFDIYLVAIGAEGGVNAWEATVLLDDRVAVVKRNADGMNVAGEDDYFVGLGRGCKLDQMVTLVHYQAILLEEGLSDLEIKLAPRETSSFTPPSPGYLSCLRPDDLRSFEFESAHAVVNPVKIELAPEDSDKPQFETERSGR